MKSCTRLLATTVAMIATLAAEPAAFAPATAEAASRAQVGSNTASQRVKLGLNKSVVIDLPADAYDILVANPTVADAVTRTARRIYLFGKAVGQTNIFVFGPNGEQIVSLDLAVERDVAGLEDYIKRFIPNSQIKVELINDNVVLTGTVDTQAAKRLRANTRRPRPVVRRMVASISTIPTRSARRARSSTSCRSSARTR